MNRPANVYRARWVVRAEGPPIPDGTIVVEAGRIARLGPWSLLRRHVSASDGLEHFPDGALLPAFVNAHTHLGLSDMQGRFRPTRNFPAWIGRLTARLWTRGKGAAGRALRLGVEQSLAAGSAAVADMAHDPTGDVPPDEPRGRWTVFRELFRFGEDGLSRLEEAVASLAAQPPAERRRVGLAPHAPYTVSVEVFRAARREADARGWPVTTHLHETEDEIAFTERGEGTLCEWMRRLKVLPPDWRPAGKRPIPMLAEAGFFSGPVLVAHGNYLTDEDIRILHASGSSVAYCPRSHAFFGHKAHPWRQLQKAGVNVCLGTDSLASCPSLSLLDEVRFLATREPDADPHTLLRMATADGARALGLADQIGDLAEGQAAEFLAIGPIPETEDPLAAIAAGEGEIRRVVGL